MRTNIDIDDGLMRQAIRHSGVRTKKAAVEAGLRVLVETYGQQSIRRLKGKVHGKAISTRPAGDELPGNRTE